MVEKHLLPIPKIFGNKGKRNGIKEIVLKHLQFGYEKLLLFGCFLL